MWNNGNRRGLICTFNLKRKLAALDSAIDHLATDVGWRKTDPVPVVAAGSSAATPPAPPAIIPAGDGAAAAALAPRP